MLLSVIGGANPQAGRAMFLVSIGITFVTGAFGNHLYRKQVARLVAGAQGPTARPCSTSCRSRGGVSIPALVISLVIVGLFVLVVLLAGIQAAQEEQNRLDALNAFNMPAAGPPIRPASRRRTSRSTRTRRPERLLSGDHFRSLRHERSTPLELPETRPYRPPAPPACRRPRVSVGE